MQQIQEGTPHGTRREAIYQRYRTLLPLAAQAKFLWARLRPGGGFAYGPYRTYAALSFIRMLPVALILALGGILWHEENVRTLTTQIVDGLNSNSGQGAAAVLALWESPPVVRNAVVNHLLESPAPKPRAVGTDWVRGVTSIKSATALDLANLLRNRLAKPDLDPITRRSLINAYGSATARLDAPGGGQRRK